MLEKARRPCNNELIRKDIYKIAQFPINSFDYVLDIGANIGTFSLMLRVLNRAAKIVAVEPNKENFAHLTTHMAGLGIITDSRALGDGSTLWLRERAKPHPLDHRFMPSRPENSSTYPVPSIRLHSLFEQYHQEGEYCIKCNCEGGERYFIAHPEDEKVLQGAKSVNLMVHFPGSKSDYPDCPTWEEYTAWIKHLFSSTHSIHYGHSHRGKGRGIFNMVKL